MDELNRPDLRELLQRLERDPDDAAALARMGLHWLRERRFREAAAPLERAIKLRPKDDRLGLAAAECRMALGDARGAKRHLKRLVRSGCDDPRLKRQIERYEKMPGATSLPRAARKKRDKTAAPSEGPVVEAPPPRVRREREPNGGRNLRDRPGPDATAGEAPPVPRTGSAAPGVALFLVLAGLAFLKPDATDAGADLPALSRLLWLSMEYRVALSLCALVAAAGAGFRKAWGGSVGFVVSLAFLSHALAGSVLGIDPWIYGAPRAVAAVAALCFRFLPGLTPR